MNVSTSPFGRWRIGWTVVRSAQTASTSRPVIDVDQVQPVGADVGHGPQLAALLGQDAPVVVGVVEQPVLDVAAADGEDVAQRRRGGPCSRASQAERIEADVVVHAGGQPVLAGPASTSSADSRGVHGQRLLAQHVLAGLERPAGHLEVQALGVAMWTACTSGSARTSSKLRRQAQAGRGLADSWSETPKMPVTTTPAAASPPRAPAR